MKQPTGLDRDAEQACLLLREYSFELGGYRPGELVAIWRDRLGAEPSWIRSAVVEALYQGRYKAWSVEQILQGWKRRGHPTRHYDHDFERVVFGPVDPTASKYAPMTTLRPSELLTPQQETSNSHLANSEMADSIPSDSPETAMEASESISQQGAEALKPVEQTDEADKAIPADATSLPPVSFTVVLGSVPSSGMAADPASNAQLSTFNQPEPIRQFVPQPEPSEFYFRLQSVARRPFVARHPFYD
ncbi:MAG: hypothetical protein F6K42_37990 [Leptolyngbya sp. SIO1D8]|nr:hypothetical protein [Leptolyngbya sp. SIO1D8]